MCDMHSSFLLFSGTAVSSLLLVKINLRFPEIYVPNIYVREPLILGIQDQDRCALGGLQVPWMYAGTTWD